MGTEYQCKGRILNIGEDSHSDWTPSVLVSTDKEEVITPLPTTSNIFEIASDSDPEVVTDGETETTTELKLILEAEREKPDTEPETEPEGSISDANAQPVASPKGDAGRVGSIAGLIACCILLAFKG